jgi:solute carrier family 8 (sodium/calcium exchanger)
VKCGENAFQWRSQPLILGRYPAGNILLSFSVLMAGASISKISLVFKHMGLYMFAVRTFFKHQKRFLFPAVLYHWENYQGTLLSKLRGINDIVWNGDGRFDSMGHSAKYGAYSIFCCTLMKIIHFELLQVIYNKILFIIIILYYHYYYYYLPG